MQGAPSGCALIFAAPKTPRGGCEVSAELRACRAVPAVPPGLSCLSSSSSPGLPPGSLRGINILLPFGCWVLPGGLLTAQGTARWQEGKLSNCWDLWWLRVCVHLVYPTPWMRGCTSCLVLGTSWLRYGVGKLLTRVCLKLPGAGDVHACAAWIP